MSKSAVSSKDRYVAYVSTYTRGHEYGIHIYDVDMENGVFLPKEKVNITNSSFVSISHNKKNRCLYSITDTGIECYKIDPRTGGLTVLNHASIRGMRGCYITSDYQDKYLFVAGYHDGKVTSLSLNKDGSIGEIVDEIYHHGMGSIAERNFRPHVSCVKMTKDNKYLLVAESGMDHVDVYKVKDGKLRLIDIIRCDIESSPHRTRFSMDGRFLYILHELKNTIDVYTYEDLGKTPEFKRIQTISTLGENPGVACAACALNFTYENDYVLASNDGDNSATLYSRDENTGMLTKLMNQPISGNYPKDAAFFPDNRHIVSLNHESNTLTFFAVHPDNGYIAMNAKEIHVDKPNCVIFYKLED